MRRQIWCREAQQARKGNEAYSTRVFKPQYELGGR